MNISSLDPIDKLSGCAMSGIVNGAHEGSRGFKGKQEAGTMHSSAVRGHKQPDESDHLRT